MKQYAASKRIIKLNEDRRSYFLTGWQNDFYNKIWNVNTAQGIGLDIWGRIVVVDRNITIVESDFFGFNTDPVKSWKPFNQGVFYSGEKASSVYRLSDNAYRALILAKALSNISDTSIPSLNKALRSLFPGRGNAYVRQVAPMAIEYVFDFFLEPWEQSVVKFSEAMPRPAGVSVSVVDAQIPFEQFELAANRLYKFSNIDLPANLTIN